MIGRSTRARMPSVISRRKRRRFSYEPPYSSVRVLVSGERNHSMMSSWLECSSSESRPVRGGDHRGLDVLVDDPLHLLVAHDVDAAVVEESGEGGGGRAGHAALLQQLDAHVAAGVVHPLDEVRHAVVEQRVPEVAVALAHRADAGGLEPGDVQVLDVAGRAADPLEAVLDARQPVVDHRLEPGVVAGERAGPAAVRRHEQPVVQAHGADGDRLEGGAQRDGGGDGHGELWHGVTGAGEKKRGIRLDEFPVSCAAGATG